MNHTQRNAKRILWVIEMGSPKEHAVNLFFGSSSEMDDINKKDNPSEAFIILQNNRLHSENSKLQTKLDKTLREKDILSQDVDSMDRSRVCLRGLLHNEIEINKLRGELCNIYKSDLDHNVKAIKSNVYETSISLTLIASLAVSQHLTPLGDCLPMTIVQACLLLGTLLSSIIMCMSLKTTDANHIVQAVESAEKGSDNLHSVIDEL